MKIAFIRPAMFGDIAKDAMTPLVFSIIKPLTPDDVDIVFHDERVENLPIEPDADVIAMTVETFTAKRAYDLAATYKKQNKTIIMGGFHPTMLPDECSKHSDSVIVGEAEDTWAAVIRDLKNDDLRKKYVSRNDSDLSETKYDYSVFEGKKYNRIGLVQFGRGCRFGCDFCSIHAFHKNTIRCKSVKKMIEEIKNMKEKYLFFTDDNLFSNEDVAKQLFLELIPLGKKWFCQISIDMARNTELLKLMRKSGCLLVLIGFESLDINNLKQMGKGANIRFNDYEKAIRNIYDAHLMIYGTFVIGYEHDTVRSTEELVRFATDNKFALANFNPLMPMPGTDLYERLKKENRLTYEDWWINPDYEYGAAMLRPKSMTEKELTDCCKNARYSFNSYKNIFKRLLNFEANAGSIENAVIFLIANLISRFEIKAKQGRKLGS